MAEEWSEQRAQASVVRVIGPDGVSVGAGVFVGQGRVLTCAHVVNAALGRPERAQELPGEEVNLEFPLLSENETRVLRARVDGWVPPPSERSASDDLAVLALLADPPAQARPAALLVNPPAHGGLVYLFGYPPHRPKGAWAPAVARGIVGNGRLQLDGDPEAAWQAQRGFSGTAVFDTVTGRVAGLFAETAPGHTAVRDGYAISTDRVRRAWPDLLRSGGTPAVPRLTSRGEAGDQSAKVTVLHVSDTQFGKNHVFGGNGLTPADQARDTLFSRLHDDLEKLALHSGLHPDLLLVSGDLAERGLRSEFEQVSEFLTALTEVVQLPRHRVAMVPGNHDINRDLCEGYFLRQRGKEVEPAAPYFPKWEPFAEAFRGFFQDTSGVAFSPGEPWTLFEMPDLAVVVAGLNSTMAESHRHEDHYGWLGEEQLRWFAERLRNYRDRGWLRLGLVHHNAVRGAELDDENLRDADELDSWLGQGQLLNLLLHGHTHDGRLHRLPSGLIALSTGSAAVKAEARPTEVPNQYQLITLESDGFTRFARQYAPGQKRWISDARISVNGSDWQVREAFPFSNVHATFPAPHKKEKRTARPSTPDEQPPSGSVPAASMPGAGGSFLERVLEATTLRYPDATVTAIPDRAYLRVTRRMDGTTLQWPVGVVDGELTEQHLHQFAAVHSQFAAADPTVPSELVCGGRPPSTALVTSARQAGIRSLRSFVEYQGLLDLRPLVERQSERLANDPLYPAALYVSQRYRVLAARTGEPEENLLGQVIDWLGTEAARFVMVLGDFGRGKTSLLRQLARTMPDQLPGVLPVLVELRSLEKAPSLDELLGQHLLRHGVEDVNPKKLQYMIRSGRVALLFDGFDELELRLGYDNAADYLQVLLTSISGEAKVVLTSRTQHFISDEQVRTALGQRVAGLGSSRIVVLEDFAPEQILTFLAHQYGGDQVRAQSRFDLLGEIEDLLGLSRNPRMLAWISALDEIRLREIQERTGRISAAELYGELVDYWLLGETTRQTHRHGLPTLEAQERLTACTELAKRLWSSTAPNVPISTLTDTVSSTLTKLSERGYDMDQAAHAVGSGSLLVRTEDGAFAFVHASVMEWLVANAAADQLAAGRSADLGASRPMSRLMIDFFLDLAGTQKATQWAHAMLGTTEAPAAAKQNAVAVLARCEQEQAFGDHILGQQLAGIDLRGQDLTGADLSGADLSGADLRGMQLNNVNFSGANLTNARLDGTRVIGGSILRARLSGSSWHRAALLGVDGAMSPDTDSADAPAEWRTAAIVGVHPVQPMLTMTGATRAVAFSGGGDLLAVARASAVEIVDVSTGYVVSVLAGPAEDVYGLAFSPNKMLLATASADHTARIWDVATGAIHTTLQGRTAVRVAFSPDGMLLATADATGNIRTWDVATGTTHATLEGSTGLASGVTFNANGTLLATACADRTAQVWEVAAGKILATMRHASDVSGVAFSPDGTLLATASRDGTARIWEVATGTPRTWLEGHASDVFGVAFSPDGTLLATASADRTARIWEVATGATRAVLAGHTSLLRDVAFSPDGTLLATASLDETARIWDVSTGTSRTVLRGHLSPVRNVAFSADGGLMATASADGTARIWDVPTATIRTTLDGHASLVHEVAFSHDNALMATASADGTAQIWDVATGAARLTLAHERDVSAVAFSPDGILLATGTWDKTAQIWDVATGAARLTLAHRSDVNAVAFSPDGMLLATGSDDRNARIWNVPTGTIRTKLTGHTGFVFGVAFSPDGTRLATASGDHTVRIWNVTTGTTLTTLKGHTSVVLGVAFSPDGMLLATASADRTARIRDVATGTIRATLQGHTSDVYAVTFSPEGVLLSTASRDGTVRIWEVATGDHVATLVGLPEGGQAVLLPDGAYKLEGDAAGVLWWSARLCRFELGELDDYDPQIRRLQSDAAVISAPSSAQASGGPVGRPPWGSSSATR